MTSNFPWDWEWYERLYTIFTRNLRPSLSTAALSSEPWSLCSTKRGVHFLCISPPLTQPQLHALLFLLSSGLSQMNLLKPKCRKKFLDLKFNPPHFPRSNRSTWCLTCTYTRTNTTSSRVFLPTPWGVSLIPSFPIIRLEFNKARRRGFRLELCSGFREILPIPS